MDSIKRIVSFLLALLLVLSVFPLGSLTTGAQAAAENFYSFDLLTNFPDGGFSKTTAGLTESKDLIRQYFNEGKIGWALENLENGTKYANGQTPIDNTFTQAKFLKGTGIQINTTGYNWWVAIRIKAPGTGTYDLSINTALARSNELYKHSIWTESYFFAADKVTGSTGIKDLLVRKNQLDMFAPLPENPDAFLGNVSMQAGKEYIIVLRMTNDTRGAVPNTDLRTSNLYLKGITLTEAAPPPVDTSKVTFDFDLADKKNVIFSNNTYINNVIDTLDEYYKDGLQNWTLATGCGTDARFRTVGGMTSYGKPDDYLAMKIKFPGEGQYTLTLNHGKSGRGATGAVYILPGDTKDITFAMDNHNRVGKVAFYNDTGDVAVEDGYSTMLGTWEFKANKEYIVVIEAYEASPYFAQAYMYVDALVCEKGDKTSVDQSQKEPHSVVVDPAPVKQLEVCTYSCFGEVNGDDYFFLPLEGKKMAVYNLDTKALVDYADTPFTQVKGMCMDQEGMLWMIGDNPYIYRYDPVMNVGKSVYYYKNLTAEERTDKVMGVTCAFGLNLGEDGWLYMGCYPVGVLGKYNPVTEQYVNMGKVGEKDDSNTYASSPVYHNGYVYITTTGDRNSDGVKTMELAKFDAVTNERVMVKDITQYLSQQEVMVRGMGACGDVLIMGGERNDVKQVAAFDVETLEFVDVGLQTAAIYGPTAEIDGKVWFVTSTAGICEYDSSTRKATTVKGLESITGSLRGGKDSFVTIEGDDLFPGLSIATWRGDSDSIGVYNVTTGRFMRIMDVVKPEYGSTSIIRPLVKVPGESSKLYIGAFNTDYCSIYDTELGKITTNFLTNGQTDSILVYQGKLFVGNYNAGVLTQINLEDKNRNVRLLSLKDDENRQTRIHALAGGDNKVFVGSVPDRYELGGCLAWIDIKTLDKHVERNVVQDQSVTCLAYHESGYVIGGCNIQGGSGSVSPEGASAKFFVYDVAEKKKVAEYDLRNYFPGDTPKIIEGIDGLIIDENGKVWMVAFGSLFTFTLDANGAVEDMKKVADFGRDTSSDWFPTAMLQIDGYLYANFGKVGGVQKVNMSNPSDHERIPIPATDSFAVGGDGNIYYSQNTAALYMYPLVVTKEDRQAATAMDAVFAGLKKNTTTLESEADIKAAREAYEALTWAQKALVDNLDYLVAAEIDLLECKIDAIGEVTLEKENLIFGLKAEYQALSAKNKSYVKNFDSVLVPSLAALQGLIDRREANRVQALIDTIPGMGEITLEKEEAVRAIETAYNNLTKSQKALVDATHLTKALATIRKLRDERIEYLKQLIASIGEVTLEDEAVITEARTIFDWLTHVEREDVDYVTLNAAEAALKKLQKEAAAKVDQLILAIGDNITFASKDAIAAARKAYDALTPGAKKLVKNLGILTEAEAMFAELLNQYGIFGKLGMAMNMDPVIVIIITVAGGAVLIGAAVVIVLLVLKKKKAAASAEEEASEEEETPAEPEA